MQESGKDYVLQTYLDQLPDGPVPHHPDGLSVSPKSRRSGSKDESAAIRPAGSRLPSDQVQVAKTEMEFLNSIFLSREVSGHKLKSSQTRVFVWFFLPNFSVLQNAFHA